MDLITLSSAAPEKYEVRDGDRWVGLIRHRQGIVSAYKAQDAKSVDPEPVFTAPTKGYDAMTEAERAGLLAQALAALA